MLRVDLSQARPGMELAMPVTHPRSPETVLLRAGFTLDGKTIDRLSELRAREIWIKYPGMEFVAEHISPAIVRAGQRLSGAIGSAFEEVLRDGAADLEYTSYRRAIQELMERLVECPRAGVFVMDLASSETPLSRSAGQGCFIALLLGLKLETYLMLSRARLGLVARDVSNLGMGALLRDIGMLARPAPDRWQWRLCCDEVDPTWRDHVTAGYEMVRGEIEPSAAAAVLHHHQHFDGSGFPHRTMVSGKEEPLRGTDIHIFARIIAAADVFERMRFPPAPAAGQPEPAPVPVVRVLNRLLRGPESAWLDPMVMKALVQAAPPFPQGSLVTLSNGLRCAVTACDPRDPCRPEVAVLDRFALEPGKFEHPRERIDLRETEHLHIAEAEGQDVSTDLFFPQTPDEFDVHKAQTALIRRPMDGVAG
ncbi:MAG TPA: HD domain-containing phosphohydrolase [Phycisphaerales bacterium]|nr:HD domain-containing phosphohydrolase [Phycisphaerales bacterium]